jgi:hypothetical protein
MKLIGRFATRMARRSKWLGKYVWFIGAAEAAMITRRHWTQLEPHERKRLYALIRKSRGRPSKLTQAERDEASALLQKLDYAKLGGDVTGTLLPFGPFSRLVEFALGRVGR